MKFQVSIQSRIQNINDKRAREKDVILDNDGGEKTREQVATFGKLRRSGEMSVSWHIDDKAKASKLQKGKFLGRAVCSEEAMQFNAKRSLKRFYLEEFYACFVCCVENELFFIKLKLIFLRKCLHNYYSMYFFLLKILRMLSIVCQEMKNNDLFFLWFKCILVKSLANYKLSRDFRYVKFFLLKKN